MGKLSGGENQAVVPIGPFSGGLNQLEDSRIIGDDQLAVCQNVDIGRSGELSIRPGLRLVKTATSNIRMIGTALKANNTTRAFYRLTATSDIHYADAAAITSNAAWTSIGSTVAGATEKVVQYSSKAWFIPKDVQPGGSTAAQGVSMDLTSNAVATVAAMPRGTGAIVFKDRLFIFGPIDANNAASQRVYYSAATDFTSFPAANFFDINPGDGEGITAAYTSQDTLVFFKRHSTYVLFYDTDPGLGVLRKVNSQIGVTGPDAVQQFENALFIIDEKTIYRVQNLLFIDIGKNLNITSRRTTVTFGSTTQDFVFVFGTKIMFIIYTGRAGAPYEYYVYNTVIDAWTQYVFNEQPERFYSIVSGTSFEDDIATKTGSANLYVFSPFRSDDPAFGDYPNALTAVTVRTKKYSMGNASLYKRLFWWGMEAYFTGQITLQSIADFVNSSTSSAITSASVTQPTFIKGFVANRGRYLEFLLTSSYANQRLLILPGVAYVTAHASVDAASNV